MITCKYVQKQRSTLGRHMLFQRIVWGSSVSLKCFCLWAKLHCSDLSPWHYIMVHGTCYLGWVCNFRSLLSNLAQITLLCTDLFRPAVQQLQISGIYLGRYMCWLILKHLPINCLSVCLSAFWQQYLISPGFHLKPFS